MGGSTKIKYLVIQLHYKGAFEGKYSIYTRIIINCEFCSINSWYTLLKILFNHFKILNLMTLELRWPWLTPGEINFQFEYFYVHDTSNRLTTCIKLIYHYITASLSKPGFMFWVITDTYHPWYRVSTCRNYYTCLYHSEKSAIYVALTILHFCRFPLGVSVSVYQLYYSPNRIQNTFP